MTTFADKAIDFHHKLELNKELPLGIKRLNPYADNPEITTILQQFYTKFYSDSKKRKLIVGINPGRLGAGATGIPFTDTKRLLHHCGITPPSFETHEPSSVFVYKVIEAYGGAESFYSDFYINSVCPLGFVRKNKKNNWVNCNYYDFKTLYKSVKPFIISSLKEQVSMGLDDSVCFSFGKKNAQFLEEINNEIALFKRIVPLPHPRYIVQYKSKEIPQYINLYLETLTNGCDPS